jgi:hypothetical protein
MKTIPILTALLMMLVVELPAQSAIDTSAARQQRKHLRLKFTDQNGDGIHDKNVKGAMDRFIDANGDGICDERERGLGFQRCESPQRNQHGKKQRGKK